MTPDRQKRDFYSAPTSACERAGCAGQVPLPTRYAPRPTWAQCSACGAWYRVTTIKFRARQRAWGVSRAPGPGEPTYWDQGLPAPEEVEPSAPAQVVKEPALACACCQERPREDGRIFCVNCP